VNPKVNTSKSTLRERIRARLAELPATEVRAHSASVWERLAVLPAFPPAQSVMTYVSHGNEIDTHGLIRQLLAMGRQVCVPAFAGEYVPAVIHDFDADLVEGRFGILEPKSVIPANPEVWLVPGLAFDVKGNRLGRGGGFFDALLRRATGAKIALAHDFQLLDEVPAETHDVRVDFIVTESRVVNCKG
jgi:5-formyltetrahydrofolate cyclo-ligase